MDNNGRTMIILLVAAILIAAGAFLYFEFAKQDIEVDSNSETPPLNLDMNDDNDNEPEWRFSTTTEYSIQYPDLNLEYVEMTDWPPQVEITQDEFACEEAGEPADRAGETKSVTVGGQEYCRTVVMEGAAGSTYTQYAYAFPEGDGTAILTFSTRVPECANYEESEADACEAEIDELDVDDLADRIARTLRVTEDE